MMGFGLDGANVMTGRKSGVATRLKRRQPKLVAIHCVAHRLALAAAESGERVHFIRYMFKPTLAQLFRFYENSAV